ncbi:MAG: amino acid permease [Planctomycetes bacterium]|nr:amino acid permease [Planctomycetota bacterium]
MSNTLFATKPIDQLQADAEHKGGLKRELGAWDLTLLGIGAIIGTGIFVLTGMAAANNAGPAVTLSFVIAGIASAFAGLCYSEMASMIPIAGSAYTYSYATMGELVAWIIGWDLILEYLVGAATVSVGWSSYMCQFLNNALGIHIPSTWTTSPFIWVEAGKALPTGAISTGQFFHNAGAVINLPAVVITLLVTMILIRGVKESARFNAVVVFVKVAVVLLFIAFVGPKVVPENWQPFIPEPLKDPSTGEPIFGKFGVTGIFQGATTVFFAYIGFDAVSTAAQEAKRPQRDLPIGILASLAICTVLYIAVSGILTGVVPYGDLKGVSHPVSFGAERAGIKWLEHVIEIGAIAGLSSVMLVMLMGQPRIFYSMARDGLLPAFAAKIHPKYGTPHITTAITGVVCAVAGGLLPIDILGELCSIGTLFAFVLVSLGVMILRIKRPDIERKFKVPGGPYLVPLLGVATSGLLMYTATTATIVRLFVWMALGLLIYFVYGMRHSKMRKA